MRICPECLRSEEDAAVARCPVDGAGLLDVEAGDDPRLGTVIRDAYLVLGVLGEGGMGRVYRAWQRSTARAVAVKVLTLPGGDADKAALAARFTREARLMARLRSPNTVVLHDFGQLDDGTFFLVMELLSGQTLDAALAERGALALDEVREVAIQVCRSLAEAHAQDIVHRDLKPANIALERGAAGDLVVKVLDFGVAKVLDEAATTLTATGAAVGTIAYMSPEQVEGGDVTGATDLYALGVTLFELACGRRPFEAESRTTLMFKHVTAPPPRLTERLAGPAVAGLDAIIQRCLAKRAEARWESADALRAAVTAWDAGAGAAVAPTLAVPSGAASVAAVEATLEATGVAPAAIPPGPPAPPALEAAPRRRRWPYPAALTGALLVVLWGVQVWGGPAASSRARPAAPEPTTVAANETAALPATEPAASDVVEAAPDLAADTASTAPDTAPLAADTAAADSEPGPADTTPTPTDTVSAVSHPRPETRPPVTPAARGPKVSGVSATGPMPLDAVKRHVRGLEPTLRRCYTSANVSAPVTVRVMVQADGHATSVRASGAPEAAAFTTCIDGPTRGVTFQAFAGNFTAISFKVGR